MGAQRDFGEERRLSEAEAFDDHAEFRGSGLRGCTATLVCPLYLQGVVLII